MQVRRAMESDLPVILGIYEKARQFMAASGNPTQWGTTEPGQETLEGNIRSGSLYVVEKQSCICGVFFFQGGTDPTYRDISGEGWHSNGPYCTIHRVASDGSGGILRACLDFCRERSNYLRMDTHENNRVMQRHLEKYGFKPCGIIHVGDGSPRIAYDWLA